jgi:ATP-binding cassette, subfamily G (WHITE), member 2, SNQ2
MINYAGYVIPRPSMRKFIGWIYWINPLAYSFSGLMENEFGKTDVGGLLL